MAAHHSDGNDESAKHLRDLQNRVEQLEGLRNIVTTDGYYEELAAGKRVALSGVSSPGNGQAYIPVPVTLKSQLGSPTALAIGGFATTLTTLSLSLMGFRSVSITNAYIGNFFGIAGIGMFVSANWELVLGNTYAYTTLGAFGLFYAGFGFIVTPSFGVAASYPGGAEDPMYNNALGFFVLMWAVLNLIFLIGSFPLNLVFIGIFFFVELAFVLVASSYFLAADGKSSQASAVGISGGAMAFIAGMLGFYTMGNLMCQEALQFSFPMGDTSHYFKKKIDKGVGRN